MLTNETIDLLRSIPSKKTLIITIGNTFRSDDGIGPFIFENLKDNSNNLLILNAGDRPENIIEDAIALKPEHTIIIDAASFQGTPGEVKIIPVEAVPDSTMSTHTFPIRIIAHILNDETGSDITFLGIQAKSFDYGETISEEILAAGKEILKILKNI